MTQTHQVVIHTNAADFGVLEARLMKYFRENKIDEPVAEDGGIRYKLGDGLNILYSKNGNGTAHMTIAGSKARVEKGVSVLREMYSCAIDAIYNI
ncbi:MAG: hypothetical protein AABX33_01670 [Nanoarchaeota archaeon]